MFTVRLRLVQTHCKLAVIAGFSGTDDVAVGIANDNGAARFRVASDRFAVRGNGEIGWRIGRGGICGRFRVARVRFSTIVVIVVMTSATVAVGGGDTNPGGCGGSAQNPRPGSSAAFVAAFSGNRQFINAADLLEVECAIRVLYPPERAVRIFQYKLALP